MSATLYQYPDENSCDLGFIEIGPGGPEVQWIAAGTEPSWAKILMDRYNSHDALVKVLSNIMSAKWTPEGMSEELADAARAALTAAGAA